MTQEERREGQRRRTSARFTVPIVVHVAPVVVHVELVVVHVILVVIHEDTSSHSRPMEVVNRPIGAGLICIGEEGHVPSYIFFKEIMKSLWLDSLRAHNMAVLQQN